MLFPLPGIILHSLYPEFTTLYPLGLSLGISSSREPSLTLQTEAGTSFGLLQPPGFPSQPCASASPSPALTPLGHHYLARSTIGLGAL